MTQKKDDIVERLRAVVDVYATPSILRTCGEGADEIVRLRKEIESLRRPAWRPIGEALKQIAQRANESGTGEMALLDTIHAMHGIAVRALASLPTPPGEGDGSLPKTGKSK